VTWGRWRREGASLRLDFAGGASIALDLRSLASPASLAAAAAPHLDHMTARDVIDLHVAANDLLWRAFDYSAPALF
jgi:hypothetical protein